MDCQFICQKIKIKIILNNNNSNNNNNNYYYYYYYYGRARIQGQEKQDTKKGYRLFIISQTQNAKHNKCNTWKEYYYYYYSDKGKKKGTSNNTKQIDKRK